MMLKSMNDKLVLNWDTSFSHRHFVLEKQFTLVPAVRDAMSPLFDIGLILRWCTYINKMYARGFREDALLGI